jgi:hypothetical protein
MVSQGLFLWRLFAGSFIREILRQQTNAMFLRRRAVFDIIDVLFLVPDVCWFSFKTSGGVDGDFF